MEYPSDVFFCTSDEQERSVREQQRLAAKLKAVQKQQQEATDVAIEFKVRYEYLQKQFHAMQQRMQQLVERTEEQEKVSMDQMHEQLIIARKCEAHAVNELAEERLEHATITEELRRQLELTKRRTPGVAVSSPQ
jgi:hypothetical protein